MNKKAMDISLNFIILAVLALIALILVAMFFTGGLQKLFGDTSDIGSTSAEQYAYYRTKCEYYCSISDEDAWDYPGFPEELENPNTGNTVKNCEQILPDKNWETDCA